MRKWDYQVLEITPDATGNFQHSLQTTLRANGAQGWELIEILPSPGEESSMLLISKKPVGEKT
jgi:uncharacterized protein DUF4177